VWAAVDQPGDDTFAYLAFSRAGGGGTTYLAFELNRDGRLWFNGRANIPCRRTDDLLITYETQGNVPLVQVRRWVTDDADERTSCATRGHFDDPVGVDANQDAQGQLNGAPIVAANNYLGGAFAGATVPTGQFGEVSLNLSDIAESVFGDRCLAYSSVWMHSRASRSLTSQKKDFVAPQRLPARSCTASGTKFWDSNADGVRQLDGSEPGLPRWKIWADYDNDGRHDPDSEPYDVTDDDGQYLIFGLRSRGEYRLRETVLRGRRGWVCSAPATTVANGRFRCAHGPFTVAETPNVENADFGNWFPARLTLEKFIFPPTDPGTFDLLVDGQVRLSGAGNGSRRTIRLPPGTYDVSEQPAAGTLAANYTTAVDCQTNFSRRGTRRSGALFEDLALVAGARATCTFTNTRIGEPAIAIRKSGPGQATAGDTLRYTFVVSNPGEIPIRGDSVVVTDPDCNDDPALVGKRSDGGADLTPETLDPLVDEWEYSCSRRTAEPGLVCETRAVDNTGTVAGTAEDGRPVTAEDTITTILRCPDPGPGPGPEPPDPVPPDPPGPEPPRPPDVPGPVQPPGPRPPEAGVAGRAAFLFARAARGCIETRLPRLNFRGTRIARIRVSVNGRLRRDITVRALQRRVTPRVTLAPGRHRVTVRVVFHRGAGTPPVTLSRMVEVCAGQAVGPRFTG
jgi:hypothetical protein